jgi:hypothetical protein
VLHALIPVSWPDHPSLTSSPLLSVHISGRGNAQISAEQINAGSPAVAVHVQVLQ